MTHAPPAPNTPIVIRPCSITRCPKSCHEAAAFVSPELRSLVVSVAVESRDRRGKRTMPGELKRNVLSDGPQTSTEDPPPSEAHQAELESKYARLLAELVKLRELENVESEPATP